MVKYDYIIIGNGILGIHLARYLTSRNESYVILEKSNNVGGRFASRRFKDVNLNYGVQSFNWNEDFFIDEVKLGLSHDLLKLEDNRVYAVDTFNSWTKFLAKDLNSLKFEAKKITREESLYCVTSTREEVIYGGQIIVTAPAPQAYSLVKDLGDFSHLNDASYLKESFYLFSHYKKDITNSELTVCDVKEINKKFYYLAKVKFFSEKSREEIREYFDKQIEPIESFAHKWRYSQVENTCLHEDVLEDIFCLGDYYSKGLKGSYDSAALFKQKYH